MGRRTTTRSAFVSDVLLVVAGSAVIAGLAQLSVQLPFTPVPVTGQTLGVMLVAAALGPWRGPLSVLLYLAEGAAGFPVFAAGSSGIATLTGINPVHPTGGYLWGFVAGAFVIGLLSNRKWDRGVGSAIGAMLVGEIVIFACGIAWLSAALNIPGETALELGLYPFVLGEIGKLLVAAGGLPAAWRLAGGPRGRQEGPLAS